MPRIAKSPITVRPTLIVGLGGTGELVCRVLQAYIAELLGSIPPFVRFLKLDTDTPEPGGPVPANLKDHINLFHYMHLGAVVRDYADYPERHPHLAWLKGLRLDASFADHGCEGIPRLGRLVFVHLREKIIHPAVSARLSDLRQSTELIGMGQLDQFRVEPGGAPVVHIASSVCGGTGAGMLIDMAYGLRWWSSESFDRPAEIVAHLMLPEAFRMTNDWQRQKLEANAAATLSGIRDVPSNAATTKATKHIAEAKPSAPAKAPSIGLSPYPCSSLPLLPLVLFLHHYTQRIPLYPNL